MASFYLKIIACDRVFFQGKCNCLIIPGLDGEQAIMAYHEEMVIANKVGELKFQLEDETWKTAAVGSGFVEVVHNRVSMLVTTAEYPEEIDANRAKGSLEHAEEALRQKQSMLEYRRSKAAMERALSRLKEAQKKSINL